ncbi:MAG: hypothetical protein ACREE7_16770, partial [Dongiaceae bacterium]
LDALKQWVRSGGQLVIGLGASGANVIKSGLAEILPLQGNETTETVRSLPRFLERMAKPGVNEFHSPIPVVAMPPARGVPTFWDYLPGGRRGGLIVMEMVGSGRVVTVAASLRDLTSVPPKESPDDRLLLHELFDVNPVSEAFLKSEGEKAFALPMEMMRLFDGLVRPIEFQRTGSLLAFGAVGFVVAYGLLSTIVSWFWLQKQGRAHLSWTVFAVFAVVASAVSLGLVTVASGFERVASVNLVDLQAGSSEARAACWFGYRSPTRQRVDLALAGDGNYLRALSQARANQIYYATPLRYEAVPAKALLADTPMRATLKQFEGFWQGRIDGTIRGQLVADRAADGSLTPESWIKNELGVEIAGGYLLYLDPRLDRDASRELY